MRMMNPARIKVLEKFRTQEVFGFVTGTNRAKVSRVLNGYDKLSQAEEQSWASALGVQLKDLRELLPGGPECG